MTHMVDSARGIMRSHFRKIKKYSFNFIITLVGLPLVIITNTMLWTYVYQFGGVTELTLSQMITYQVLAFILIHFIFLRSSMNQINRDIVHGDVTIYQVRPIHYMFFRFFMSFTTFLMYGMYQFLVFIIATFFVSFELSGSVYVILLAVLSCFLAFCISFFLMFIIGSIGLWWEHSSGLFNIYTTFATFFAGTWLPLDIFPEFIRNISSYFPFQYITYIPTKIFMGSYSTQEVLGLLGIQVIWIIIFAVIAMYIWKRGIKQYTGYGA